MDKLWKHYTKWKTIQKTVVPFTWKFRIGRGREWISECLASGGPMGSDWEWTELLFVVTTKFSNWFWWWLRNSVNILKIIEFIQFKWVNHMILESYLSKAVTSPHQKKNKRQKADVEMLFYRKGEQELHFWSGSTWYHHTRLDKWGCDRWDENRAITVNNTMLWRILSKNICL